MSDDRGETVDLAYIGRPLLRLTSDVASLKDDVKVLTTIALRHEHTLARIEENMRDLARQMTAMVSQHARMADRVSGIEDRLDSFDRRVGRAEDRIDNLERGPQ